MNEGLGRTLVIANPVAHSGDGAAAAERVKRFFSSYANATDGFELRLTQAPGDGMLMAQESAGFDTVIALGGDGIIHEVANGLMSVTPHQRPALAVVPVGSGNDFARTIGAATNDPIGALGQILRGCGRKLDLGHVANDAGESAYVGASERVPVRGLVDYAVTGDGAVLYDVLGCGEVVVVCDADDASEPVCPCGLAYLPALVGHAFHDVALVAVEDDVPHVRPDGIAEDADGEAVG